MKANASIEVSKKRPSYNLFEHVWRVLQRGDTISHNNVTSPEPPRAVVSYIRV